MANEIACSIPALGSDIREIQQAYEVAVRSKERVRSSVLALNGMWKGAAHDTFTSAFDVDYETLSGLCDTINNIISCLNYAKTEYEKCEQQVRNAVSAIQI